MRVTAATAHAVVIDGQHKLLVMSDRLTLPRQAQDTRADWPGNIDGVRDPSNGVIVVIPYRLALVIGLSVRRLRWPEPD